MVSAATAIPHETRSPLYPPPGWSTFELRTRTGVWPPPCVSPFTDERCSPRASLFGAASPSASNAQVKQSTSPLSRRGIVLHRRDSQESGLSSLGPSSMCTVNCPVCLNSRLQPEASSASSVSLVSRSKIFDSFFCIFLALLFGVITVRELRLVEASCWVAPSFIIFAYVGRREVFF